jgi:glyoxylase-like metal-dependent hydrolase (beta-lactamase superfamily II)
MAAPSPSLSLDTGFDPLTGMAVRAGPGVVRVTAPNRGPYTFTGTNSYVLGEERLVLVDPGPADPRHLNALKAAIGGRPVEAILLTHTHKDHSALTPLLRAATRAPVWFEGRHRPSRPRRRFETDWVARESDAELRPDRELRDGEMLEVAGLRLEVIATPGHCANHLCFGLAGTSYLLSGDHVMGWNSTMIAVPDGSMADYVASLTKLTALSYSQYLPGHGGPIVDGRETARALGQHRELRNKQVVAAVAKGARTIGDLTKAIYPKLDLKLIPAARMTLAAHIEYLAATNRLRVQRGLFGARLAPA